MTVFVIALDPGENDAKTSAEITHVAEYLYDDRAEVVAVRLGPFGRS
jgi:hypothetical protein